MTNNTTNSILGAITRQIEAEYGRPLAEIEAAVEKAGMDVDDFGYVNNGEMYFDAADCRALKWAGGHCCVRRLILRPKPRRRILLEETGEQARTLIAGDACIDNVLEASHIGQLFSTKSGSRYTWTARELKPGETV